LIRGNWNERVKKSSSMNWVEEYGGSVVVVFVLTVVVFANGSVDSSVGSAGSVVFVFGFLVLLLKNSSETLFRKLLLKLEKLVVFMELILVVSIKLGVVELDSKNVVSLFKMSLLKMSLFEICLSKSTLNCCFETFELSGLTVSLFAW